MSFQAPAILGLLGLVIAVAWLRCRRFGRERRVVSTLEFWRRLAATRLPEAPRRKHIPAEVVLETLAGALLVCAAAGPHLQGGAVAADLVIFRDRGMAMRTPARQAAADAAVKRLQDMAAWRTIQVVDVPPGGERADLPNDDVNWNDLTLGQTGPDRRVVVVADHVAGSAPRAPVGVEIVADAFTNAGIVAARLDESGRRLFVAVASTGTNVAGRRRLEARIGTNVVVRDLDFDGAKLVSSFIDIDIDIAGTSPAAVDEIVVALTGSDDLPADDEVVLTRAPRRATLFVDEGLRAVADAVRAAGFDVVRVAPATDVATAAIRIGRRFVRSAHTSIVLPPATGAPLDMGNGVAGAAEALRAAGPLDVSFDLAGIEIRELHPVTGGVPILTSGDLTAAAWDPVARCLVVGFDLDAEAIAGVVAYPRLVTRLLEFIGCRPGSWTDREYDVMATGEAVRLRLAGGTARHRGPRRPDDVTAVAEASEVRVAADGLWTFVPQVAGRHAVEDGAGERRFSAAPLSYMETTGAATPAAARPLSSDAGMTVTTRRLAPSIAWVALACLAALATLRGLRVRRPGPDSTPETVSSP